MLDYGLFMNSQNKTLKSNQTWTKINSKLCGTSRGVGKSQDEKSRQNYS
jgi:hypothetical protein